MAYTYHLFISHSWQYSDEYERLIDLLDEKSHFSYKDYSVPKDDPVHTQGTDRELYNAIVDKLHPCHVEIILAGVYATYSKWIKKEIKAAQDEFDPQKPILGIAPWGSDRTSETVQDNADEIVGWNKDTIVSAIRRLS